MANKPAILCVDDEPSVLDGVRLHLRKRFAVDTATSGEEALSHLSNGKTYAIILSDMRMPGMNGAELLSRAKDCAPDTVRMLLTGQTDMDSAIRAVNEGQIFRFLTKPCEPSDLRAACEAAAEQHRLVTLERDLLEHTVRGSIKALTDLLSLSSPVAFGRATRIKERAGRVAAALGIDEVWQVEVAAMLSQIGAITLPDETSRKRYQGESLSQEEQAMVAEIPKVSASLIANIPRLETIRDLVLHQNVDFGGNTGSNPVPREAYILRAVIDLDFLETDQVTPPNALGVMKGRSGVYDPDVLRALESCLGPAEAEVVIRELRVTELRSGMVFAQDVMTTSGMLLVAKGTEITEGLLGRLRNRQKEVSQPIRARLDA